MTQVPSTLEDAIAQAKDATLSAMEAGYTRLQVELIIPEIALKAQAIALEFTSIFEQYGSNLAVIFPDTGAAALARRDWGEVPFKVTDLGSSRTPVEVKISEEDQAFLVVSPSSVEVGQVEKLCNLAGDRPVILLIPQLENVAIVGIGYAARQLRERFLSTLETCYYLKPLDGAAVFRVFPNPWQVFAETENNQFELITEQPTKPMGDVLERILTGTTGEEEAGETPTPAVKKSGFLGNLQQFLRALSQ